VCKREKIIETIVQTTMVSLNSALRRAFSARSSSTCAMSTD
jgi:hypothetical protein